MKGSAVPARRLVVAFLCVSASLCVGVSTAPLTSAAVDDGAVQPSTDPVAGQYIVTFDDGVSAEVVASRATALAREVAGTVLAVYSRAVSGFAIRASAEGALALSRNPLVGTVEQDGRLRAAATVDTVPWGLDRVDQRHLPLDDAYGRGAPGTGVRVYLLDGSVALALPEFQDRASLGVDVVNAPGVSDDCDHHGTDVAGAIGGATGGSAPAVSLVSVRVLDCAGTGSVSQLLAGIDWVTANAVDPAVATVSATTPASNALDAAVRRSIATGITYVAAAGNTDDDACDVSPARVPEVVTVAATDRADARATFSNIGTCVDLFAPGVAVRSVADPARTTSGTSLSAAYVAGAAARLLQLQPGLTPDQVASAIGEQATPDVVSDPGDGTPNRLLYTGFLDDAAGEDPDSTTRPPETAPSTAPPPSSTTVLPPTSAPTTDAAAGGGGPAAAVAAGKGVSAFAQGWDGGLWWRQLTQTGWWTWQAFDGAPTGTPSVVSTASGVFVFVRGRDNNFLYWQRFDGTRWSGWESLGGNLTDDPVAATNGSETYVFARGPDGGLYWRRYANGWSDWQRGGGVVTSRIAAASCGFSDFHVLVRGVDRGLHWQRVNGGAGAGWTALGGATDVDPAVACDASGLSLFARGNDTALYRQLFDGAWHGWQHLGGALLSAPAAVGVGPSIQVFARGLDSGPYVQQVSGTGRSGWSTMGGVVTAPLSATFDGSSVTVFARGGDLQLYVKTFTTGWSGWSSLEGVPLASPPVALSSDEITKSPLAPETGLGFDACETPSIAAMAAWRAFSPFTSVGVYIGGINRACRNRALDTPGWAQTVVAQGWRLIPIYVGLQAPCINFGSAQISRDLFTAIAQGQQAANDAADRAGGAGLTPGAPIYFDMEGYNGADPGCTGVVRGFLAGWVIQLHNRGFRAAMYSSLCSGIRDVAAVYNDPAHPRLDAIWIAAWNGIPNIFGFPPPCPLSDAVWPFHQRIHQYQGGHNETWGGVTINIDRNAVDGPLFP